MRTAKQGLLDRLVAVLIAEWGLDAVVRSLTGATRHSELRDAQAKEAAKRNEKPRATDLVLRADMPENRRQRLMRLAAQFDEKTFLPRLADVREFLEMRGQPPSIQLKDRSDAFRAVLKLMLRLPEDGLERLAAEPVHGGPAKLDAIADAIRSAGERLRPDNPSGHSDDRNSSKE